MKNKIVQQYQTLGEETAYPIGEREGVIPSPPWDRRAKYNVLRRLRC